MIPMHCDSSVVYSIALGAAGAGTSKNKVVSTNQQCGLAVATPKAETWIISTCKTRRHINSRLTTRISHHRCGTERYSLRAELT